LKSFYKPIVVLRLDNMTIDEHCFDIDITRKSKGGNPLIVVTFKEGYKNYWRSDHSWVPTLDELEFLYSTKKMMEHSK